MNMKLNIGNPIKQVLRTPAVTVLVFHNTSCHSSTFSSSVKAPPFSLLFLLLLACMAFKLSGISLTASSGRLRLRYFSKVHPFGMTNEACKSPMCSRASLIRCTNVLGKV